MKYFIASRWRNRSILDPLVEKIRVAGHDAYYFVEKTITKHAAGKSAHMEAEIAHGLGKRTILVDPVEETESLHLAFDNWYLSIDEFVASL